MAAAARDLGQRLAAAAARRLRAWRGRSLLDKLALRDEMTLEEQELGLLPAVSARISHRDAMHGGAGRRYYAIGLSALRCIEEGLSVAGRRDPDTILDLPCGHGRVMRWLAARYPRARLTACDLDRDGVDYCARVFAARPVYSASDFDHLSAGGPFDLIWCGSLVTHLDQARIASLLAFFARHLAPDGLLVVTTHGEEAARRLRAGDTDYLLDASAVTELLAGYERHGFGYADYPGGAGYGISLSAPGWVRERAARAGGLRPVHFRPRVWDEHQDVFGFVRGERSIQR